jgi:threonine/homoserine/homoserine lactone efflux protein
MDWTPILIFAGALFVNAGSPGPSIAALVTRVLTGGIGSVLPFLVAMWIGELLWLAVALGGLTYVAATYAAAFSLIKYAGVAYLAYLAFKMWTAPTDVQPAEMKAQGSALRMFAAGLAITVGNPKLMAFYLAILPALIDITHLSARGWASLMVTCLAVIVTVDLGWSAAASYARQWLRSPRAVKITNRVSATVMGGAALAIAKQ